MDEELREGKGILGMRCLLDEMLVGRKKELVCELSSLLDSVLEFTISIHEML